MAVVIRLNHIDKLNIKSWVYFSGFIDLTHKNCYSLN